MRSKLVRFMMVVSMIIITISLAGCSKFSQPSDADVIKAIEDSGILTGKAFKVTSPLTIVGRGDRKQDGSWPVTIKMTLIMRMPNGEMSPPRENTTTFRLVKSKARAGNSAWRAILGS